MRTVRDQCLFLGKLSPETQADWVLSELCHVKGTCRNDSSWYGFIMSFGSSCIRPQAFEWWLADPVPFLDFIPLFLTLSQHSSCWSPQVHAGCSRGTSCQHRSSSHYSAKLTRFCEVYSSKILIKATQGLTTLHKYQISFALDLIAWIACLSPLVTLQAMHE